MFGIEDGFGEGRVQRPHGPLHPAEGLDSTESRAVVEAHLDDFLARYYALLPQALREKDGYLMPGFPQLLEALSQREGRPHRPGDRQLQRGGLDQARVLRHLAVLQDGGAFGEQSLDRVGEVRLGRDRKRRRRRGARGHPDHRRHAAGHLGRAATTASSAVGVATGNYSVDQLRESGAQMVFQDFSDWQGAAATLAGAA